MSPLQSSKGRNKGKTLKGYRTGTLGQGLGTGGGGGNDLPPDPATKATDFAALDILGDGSCIAQWKMDGNANDVSGNYSSTGTNSITWTNDGIKPGTKCASFTKSGGSYITIPTVKSSFPMSVSVWVRHSHGFQASPGLMDEIFNMGTSGGRLSLGFSNNHSWNQGLSIMYGGSSHYCADTVSSIPSSVDTISNLSEELLGPKFKAGKNAWFNICFSLHGHNNTSQEVWVNGCLLGLHNEGGGHGGSAGWKIGANHGGGENWQGDICNVRFFNKAINEDDAWKCAQEFYPSGSKSTIAKDGLKLWYDFSDADCYSGSGQVKNLAPDNNKNGKGEDFWAADVNGPTFGGSGQAKYFDFDGSNDRLEVGSAAGQDCANGMKAHAYTLEAWIYTLGLPQTIGAIISCQHDASPNRGISMCTDTRSSHGGGPNGYHHQMSKNGSWTTTGSHGNTGSGTASVSNRWDHVVATFDGRYKRMYENETYLGHQGEHGFDYADRIYLDSTYWAIGCQSDGSAFNQRYYRGRIAIVRIYDVCLSHAQIKHNYQNEKARFGL